MKYETSSLGVLTILDIVPGAQLIASVQAMESMGYGSYWIPEVLGREVMSTAGYLLANTTEISIATGIANVYVRDAHATAYARHTLCELYGERFILGLGVSNVEISKIRGYAWRPPATKIAEYLEQMSALEPAAAKAEVLGPLHIAAHGPKLQALAAARSNGAVTYLMSPAHTELSRQRIGSEAELSATCMMLAETDPVRARATARKALAYYVTLDYYQREWRALGFNDNDFADGGSDALIDMLVGWGDAQALQRRVQEHLGAGANRVLVMPLDSTQSGLVESATLKALAPNAV